MTAAPKQRISSREAPDPGDTGQPQSSFWLSPLGVWALLRPVGGQRPLHRAVPTQSRRSWRNLMQTSPFLHLAPPAQQLRGFRPDHGEHVTTLLST